MDALETPICRLCFRDDLTLVCIEDDAEPNIAEMLTKHIGEVSRLDVLPNYICYGCFDKVLDFNGFYCDVQAAQRSYIDSLVQQDSDANEAGAFPWHPSATESNDSMTDSELANDGSLKDYEIFTEVSVIVESEGLDGDQIIKMPKKEKLKVDKRKRIRAAVPTCPYCSIEFSTLGEMGQHTRDVHVKELHRQIMSLMKRNRSAHHSDRLMAKHFDMTCDECDVRLTSLEDAQMHYSEQHNIADGYLKCCGQRYKEMQGIEQHLQYHQRPEKFVCVVCSVQTHSLQALKGHAYRVHKWVYSQSRSDFAEILTRKRLEMEKESSSTPDEAHATGDAVIEHLTNIKCEVCSIELTNLEHAQAHYPEHDIDRGYLKCCDKKLSTADQVAQHVLYHNNPAAFKCPMCRKTFMCATNLGNHLGRHRAAHEKRHKCDECHRTFSDTRELQAHAETHTRSELSCEHCTRKFVTEKGLQSHIERAHLKVTPPDRRYVCDFCARGYTRRSALVAHVQKVHHLKRLECDICKRKFASRETLRTHMKQHSTTRQRCPHCDKISPHETALKVHIKTVHEMDKSLSCHLCDRTFKLAKSLKDHVSRHSIEEEFWCKFCSMKFNWRQNLRRHLVKNHPEEYEIQCQESKAKRRSRNQ